MTVRYFLLAMLLCLINVVMLAILDIFLEIPPLAAVIYALGLSFGLYSLFNRRLWRWSIWRRIGLIAEPYLGGDWRVTVSSSYNDNATLHHATVEIIQDWQRLEVNFLSDDGHSTSLTARLYQEDEQWFLTYIYRLQPREDAAVNWRPTAHFGLSVLRLVDLHHLTGTYHYLSQSRHELQQGVIVGQIVFKRGLEMTDPPLSAPDSS